MNNRPATLGKSSPDRVDRTGKTDAGSISPQPRATAVPDSAQGCPPRRRLHPAGPAQGIHSRPPSINNNIIFIYRKIREPGKAHADHQSFARRHPETPADGGGDRGKAPYLADPGQRADPQDRRGRVLHRHRHRDAGADPGVDRLRQRERGRDRVGAQADGHPARPAGIGGHGRRSTARSSRSSPARAASRCRRCRRRTSRRSRSAPR